jgi:hypothetical protein
MVDKTFTWIFRGAVLLALILTVLSKGMYTGEPFEREKACKRFPKADLCKWGPEAHPDLARPGSFESAEQYFERGQVLYSSHLTELRKLWEDSEVERARYGLWPLFGLLCIGVFPVALGTSVLAGKADDLP